MVGRLAITAVAALAVLALRTPLTGHVSHVHAGPGTTTITITNNTSAAAGFLHVGGTASFVALPSVNAPGCGAPAIFGAGFEYWEIVWPSPCVDPGESVSFEVPSIGSFGLGYWAPSPPVISAVNDTGLASDYLRMDTHAITKGATLVQNAPGCAPPYFSVSFFSGVIEVTWSSACVDPGEKVSIHVGAPWPVTSASLSWSPMIGGVSLEPEVDALPSETERSSGTSAAVAGIGAAAAGAVALGCAAWYARRRLR